MMNKKKELGPAESANGCDLFQGNWVLDEFYVNLYNSSQCSFIEKQFDCVKNGRVDSDYLKYRWHPNNCSLPRFDARKFLVKMKGKKVMFVGDSLSLNQWQSLTCLLHVGNPNAKFTLQRFGPLSNFSFPKYKVSILLFRAAFLVDLVREEDGERVLKLNSISNGTQWKEMDALIFDSWHWWLHTGRKQKIDRFEVTGNCTGLTRPTKVPRTPHRGELSASLSRSGLSMPRAEAERTTYLRKPLDGRPAGGGLRMTDPAGAECITLPRRSSLVLCLGPAKWALAKLGWVVFLLGWIPPFPVLPSISFTASAYSPSPPQSDPKVSSFFLAFMTSSDSTPSIPAVDPAAACFEEMYRQDPSLHPDGLTGGINPSRVLSAVPLRSSVTVAPSSQALPLKKKKSKVAQNLVEVGILISLERQFELTEAMLGSRPKHGLEESTSRPEDLESEEREEEEDEEIETDEESGQPSHSEGIADMEPSGGDMNPVDVIRKAKLLARNRSRGEEVQQNPPSEDASGSAASVPNQEAAPTRNLRKRKVIQVEDEETASEQDTVPSQSPLSKRSAGPQDGKCPASLDKIDGDVHAEAKIASLSAVLKDEDEILSFLQGLVDGFHKKVLAKLSLISKCRAGAEFSSGVDFLASVETELSRLRKLAETKHEQAVELEMQAVEKSEEVVRLQGLLKESEESASPLTASMAELEGRLRQSEGRISELDVELAKAVSSQRSMEAERDWSLAEREQAVPEKEHAISDFLQSPSFKEACMEKMAAYYEDWLGTEAGTEKMGVEGTKWFESGVYHGIQLVLRRT
ncbi:unnamed protein product [Cuscuta campestris]|uniref:Uncharacterized protein n=1 Tax=Cuscuta campestris TaxID=132261 RepID=A0A484M5K8_9ASTE|nr:unnamed protein product [Cuscuta campestris]